MPGPRLPNPLHHAPRDFRDVMIHANIALTKGELVNATNLYSEVLYKLSPGLLCALLNRSMAFLQGGYPELAVMDAYRACVAANELRKVFPTVAILFIRDLSLRYEDRPNPHNHLER